MSDPECPADVPENAREEWARVVEALRQAGVLEKVQTPAIVGYCVAYGRWRKAEAWMAEHGTVAQFRNDKGELKSIVPVPQIGIAEKCRVAMRQFWQDAGLTPATWGKVAARVGTGEAQDDDAPSEDVEELRTRILARIGG